MTSARTTRVATRPRGCALAKSQNRPRYFRGEKNRNTPAKTMFKCDAVKIYGQEICGQEMRSQVRGFCESEGVRTLSRVHPSLHDSRNRRRSAGSKRRFKTSYTTHEINGFNLFCIIIILFCLANQAFLCVLQSAKRIIERENEFYAFDLLSGHTGEFHGLPTAILYVPYVPRKIWDVPWKPRAARRPW